MKKMVVLPILIAALAACGGGGGGGGGNGGTVVDNQAPTANITFPASAGLISNDTITVRGTASDMSDIVSITVNGVTAATEDGFSTWSATVPVVDSANTLVVATMDSEGNSNTQAASGAITKTQFFRFATSIAIDEINNIAYVSDELMQSIYAVDMTTGLRSLVTDNVIDPDEPLIRPTDVFFDGPNNRLLVLDFLDMSLAGLVQLLVLDSTPKRLVEVDITTGARQTLLNMPGDGSPITLGIVPHPVFDPDRREIIGGTFIPGQGISAIQSVNVDTGIGGFFVPLIPLGSAINAFGPVGISFDPIGNRVFASFLGLPSIRQLDLSSNILSVVSDNNPPNDVSPLLGLPLLQVYFPSRNEIIVQDLASDINNANVEFLVVDAATGSRRLLSEALNEDTFIQGFRYSALQVMDSTSQAFVVDRSRDGLVSVDVDTGDLATVSDNRTVAKSDDKVPRFFDAIDFSQSDNLAILADRNNAEFVFIDTQTGELINTVDYSSADMAMSADFVFDDSRNLTYFIDSENGRVARLQSEPGLTVIDTLINVVDSDSQESFVQPVAIAIDDVKQNLFVYDLSLNSISVINIDDQSARQVLLDQSVFATDESISFIEIDYLDADESLLMTGISIDNIFQIDVITGAVTELVIEDINGNNPLNAPSGIVVDDANNRAIVTSNNGSAVISINLDNLQTESLYEMGTLLGRKDAPFFPAGLSLRGDNTLLLASNFVELGALEIVDLASSERVILFRQ